ncbi:MAG: NIPSNAP family protein [Tannerella sp.]|jgi:hypothetical protein|nr:NIPSNAP family protein [Tannerella sp.]
MERRNFIKAAGALSVIPATSMASKLGGLETNGVKDVHKEIYEWRIYTLESDGAALDTFLKDVLLPAYNRKKVKTGAFKPYNTKEGEKGQRHVLFIYPDIATYLKVKKTIWDDKTFVEQAQAFYDETAPKPVYFDFVSYLSEAFDKIPVHRKPDPTRGLLEIRIYHSPNEEANKRKMAMFNIDEISIFDQTGINSVLYGYNIAGPNLPSIMYLTWYKDEPTRTVAWDKFREHPDWQRISKLPQYANTATRNQSILLSPLPFSQV